MNSTSLASDLTTWINRWLSAWDRFWFTPRSPFLLSLLRVTTGLFLLYSHLVLATQLLAFLGPNSWIHPELSRQLHDGTFGPNDWGRSYLSYVSSPALLWSHHIVTLFVTLCMTIGFLTRFTLPAAWLLQLMYIHRLTGALFGLDQIITYMAMYLALAPCGSFFSVDSRIRRALVNKGTLSPFYQWLFPGPSPTIATNIVTRLLQIHLCVIYLFGGLAKARGQTWWDGTAMWFAVANYEYQSINMTWLARYPRVFSSLTHVTLFWEVFYCFLVWPKILRPITLGVAVAVHGGIALFLGMATFGLAMITANAIFIDPEWARVRLFGSAGDEDHRNA